MVSSIADLIRASTQGKSGIRNTGSRAGLWQRRLPRLIRNEKIKHDDRITKHIRHRDLFPRGTPKVLLDDPLVTLTFDPAVASKWTIWDLLTFSDLCLREAWDRFVLGLGLRPTEQLTWPTIKQASIIFRSEVMGLNVIGDEEKVRRMVRNLCWVEELDILAHAPGGPAVLSPFIGKARIAKKLGIAAWAISDHDITKVSEPVLDEEGNEIGQVVLTKSMEDYLGRPLPAKSDDHELYRGNLSEVATDDEHDDLVESSSEAEKDYPIPRMPTKAQQVPMTAKWNGEVKARWGPTSNPFASIKERTDRRNSEMTGVSVVGTEMGRAIIGVNSVDIGAKELQTTPSRSESMKYVPPSKRAVTMAGNNETKRPMSFTSNVNTNGNEQELEMTPPGSEPLKYVAASRGAGIVTNTSSPFDSCRRKRERLGSEMTILVASGYDQVEYPNTLTKDKDELAVRCPWY